MLLLNNNSLLHLMVTVVVVLCSTAPHLVAAAKECPTGHRLGQVMKAFKSNGCKAMPHVEIGGGMNKFRLAFTKCCDLHDACFSVCGSSEAFCKEEGFKCVEKVCNKEFPHEADTCKRDGDEQLKMGGLSSSVFGQNQDEMCGCLKVEKDLGKATSTSDGDDAVDSPTLTSYQKRYVDVMERIFMRVAKTKDRNAPHVKRKVVKATEIMREKFTDNEWKLVYKLVAKYPQIIKKVDGHPDLNTNDGAQQQHNVIHQSDGDFKGVHITGSMIVNLDSNSEKMNNGNGEL